MNAFSNTKPKIPSPFLEKVKADLVYDTIKRENPVNFKALKEAKENVIRWRTACQRFISRAQNGE